MNQDILGQKIQELQLLERNLQNYASERQNFQIELNGINNAIDELNISKGEVYKIVGGLMVRAEKDSLTKELKEKKDIVELRIKNIEKQENIVGEKADRLKKEVNASLSNKE